MVKVKAQWERKESEHTQVQIHILGLDKKKIILKRKYMRYALPKTNFYQQFFKNLSCISASKFKKS